MPQCDRVEVTVPDPDVELVVERCVLPDDIGQVLPGDTIRTTLNVANTGADGGTGDVVIRGVPAGVDPGENPDQVVDIDQLTGLNLPGNTETARVVDIAVPTGLPTGDWRFYGTFENVQHTPA